MKIQVLREKFKIGLRGEIIVSITILMIAAILLVSYSTLAIIERDIYHDKVRALKVVAAVIRNSLDHSLKDGGSINDSKTNALLSELTKGFVGQGYLPRIIFVDNNYKAVASDYENLVGKTFSDENIIHAIRTKQTVVRRGHGDNAKPSLGFSDQIEITIPLSLQDGSTMVMRLVLQLVDSGDSLAKSRQLILFYLMPAYSIVLIVFGSYILTRKIVKPIKMLSQSSKRLASGDFDERVEVVEDNEVGELAKSFNEMARSLRENKISLEQHVRSLKSINQELNRVQEEVIKSEKQATVGKFASGMAHELGNPLGAILGYTEILKRDTEGDYKNKDYLERIEREIKRINNIIRELLDFSRPKKVNIRDVDVNSVIQGSVSLLANQKMLDYLEIDLQLEKKISPIKADEHQFQQVMINMILNAIDAMNGKGRIIIGTAAVVIDESFEDMMMSPRRMEDPPGKDYSYLRKQSHIAVHLSAFNVGDELVRVSITDTGEGIREENIGKVFDPFFTTKEPGKGTGLGLTVCLRIIESFGGRIKVSSQIGQGSTFEILLPTTAIL